MQPLQVQPNISMEEGQEQQGFACFQLRCFLIALTLYHRCQQVHDWTFQADCCAACFWKRNIMP